MSCSPLSVRATNCSVHQARLRTIDPFSRSVRTRLRLTRRGCACPALPLRRGPCDLNDHDADVTRFTTRDYACPAPSGSRPTGDRVFSPGAVAHALLLPRRRPLVVPIRLTAFSPGAITHEPAPLARSSISFGTHQARLRMRFLLRSGGHDPSWPVRSPSDTRPASGPARSSPSPVPRPLVGPTFFTRHGCAQRNSLLRSTGTAGHGTMTTRRPWCRRSRRPSTLSWHGVSTSHDRDPA